MKVLYVGGDRSDAQAAAAGLRSIAANVAVSWTSRPDHITGWIDQNRDVAALLVDGPADPARWRPTLEHVRGLASHPAVVFILPEGSPAPVPPLEAGIAEVLIKNETLPRDLPTAVRRAVDRARGHHRDAELQALIDSERAARADLEQKLAEAWAALRDAEERHRVAMAAAAEQLAKQQAQYEIGMARAAASWEMVDEQLRAAAIEVDRARRDHASVQADVERLTRRESELSSLLAEAASTRQALERRLAEALEQFAERQRGFETQIAHEIEERNGVERTLAQAAADVERLTRRESELASLLEEARSAHGDVERRLGATEAAFQDASDRATRERLAAARKAADREAELDGQLQQERAARAVLEQALADANAAMHEARERHEAAVAAAARELEERQAQFDGELRDTAAARDDLARRLNDTEAALNQARCDHQAATAHVERLSRREDELVSQLAHLQGDRDSLARQWTETATALADTESALRDAQQRHEAASAASARELADRQAQFDRELTETAAARDNLAQRLSEAESARDTFERRLADATSAIAAAEDGAAHERAAAAERQADLEGRLARAVDTCDTLERTLDETRSAARDAERAFHEEAGELRAHALEQALRLEAQLADERLEHNIRMADMQEAHRHLMQERDALRQSLGASAQKLHHFDVELRQAHQRLEQVQTAARVDAQQLAAACRHTERTLEDARRDFQLTLERVSNENAKARAALSATIAERDAQLQEQAAQHAASAQAAEAARTELDERLQRAIAARDQEIEQLRVSIAAANEALEAARRREANLQIEADRVPPLQKQLDESRAETERVFQRAPVAMFRCTRDGAVTQVNKAWTILVRRRIDELSGADFASAVFESPNDLSWLIEHCLTTGTKESIETTVRRKDGARLFVRLSASSAPAPASGVIEVTAEDLTRLRVLQDRLGQAGRMEAVGRLASEVALTCGTLLKDVQQNVRRLLVDGAANGSRHQGETLLDELTRAAGYLQQLVAYGEKQTRTPTAVDLNTVIRDLAPALKHVAGDDVEVQLPDAASPLNVDVEPERVERLLVNLAAYGRERMASGGRLIIEVGTTVVDHHFTAKYPNVRPGPHALIAVKEMRRAARADGQMDPGDGQAARSPRDRVAYKRAVDLATLQGLVGECGGHLWMRIQPLGDIVAKIRLPLLTTYDQPQPRAVVAAGGRGSAITRLFQH